MGTTANDHEKFMALALVEAEKAGKRGDLPIGAVIVHNGKVISKGSNRKHTKQSLVAHAEIDAIHSCAPYLKEQNNECVIYTTLEPCIMCLSTIITANITTVYFALEDRYMRIPDYIESTPYIKERLIHYQGGILRKQSEKYLQKYAPNIAEMVLKAP
ncbi:nucleoside deaminase [Chungangia koreensis]|uniref:Nucleoside deaminase n=1 Tax=Chungangia koreensis TaxID=752657 RepID=A0ABV8X9X6_9LACT